MLYKYQPQTDKHGYMVRVGHTHVVSKAIENYGLPTRVLNHSAIVFQKQVTNYTDHSP
jgi:hypothetical protein